MSRNLKHDLRTPLNHIIGYTEMMLEEAADRDQSQVAGDLERIHFAGRGLLNVINDLFDPIKSAAYKADPGLIHHEIRTPLNQIIGYAEILQEDARDRGAESFVSDSGKILTAARELLRQVFENFAGADGPWNNLENPPESSATIFVRNETLLPPPAAQFVDQTAGNRISGSILVADDDENNRVMLSRRLQRLGHQVTTAENGRRALDALMSGRFDLLLLDIQMPELNGYQVLEQMKASPALRDIPVIVLSASDESGRVARCIEMGAEDYLPKPFDPVLLQARIGASLEKKRLRDREVSHLRQIQEEKQRSDQLLRIILPHDVAEELKATNRVKPRSCENVSVLFCDVVAFTAYCDQHPPEEILARLQTLVEAFERIGSACGLEKIKTIGDSFMATAGLLAPLENPALHCVRCGLDMIAAARNLPPHWQVRVGVHAGSVIAGVVGHHKYQYDVWGDTVNTASRMEQAAPPGAVCVSAETWQHLADHCEGSWHGRIDIKGKGPMDLFRVERLRL
ncbi:MAG TPA: adenylate/guanylate cyclase domain-containing protein [Verrucomicrobiaceae bacterium]